MKKVEFSFSKVRIKEIPSPILGDDELIIKLKNCGICGSDIGNVFSESCKPTNKLGHEISGIIIKKDQQIEDFNVGDRVIINHHCPCGMCELCLKGNPTMCEKFVDMLTPCGMSEEIIVPKWIIKKGGIFKIPNSMSFEEAAMIEPLSCCIRAWKKLKNTGIKSLIIFGLGPIGLIHSMLANHYEINHIIGFEKSKFRLNFSQNFKQIHVKKISDENIDNIKSHYKIDLAIIATSDMSIINTAIKLIRKGGKIMIFGEPRVNEKIKIDFSEIYKKEISFFTSYSSTNDEFLEAIDFVQTRKIDVKKIISHRFPIDDVNSAINLAKNFDAMKVMLSN